ncbi:unnamed protein product [Thelazia callipaeda]|uniref:Lipoprotein signal peptidase n=1 Tax=Thelazia callipaeda TaxID=103827 RepID=A0A0N5CJ28_THECL|nr:unnamed protein product [Thelazia callipaeda]
MIVLHLAQDRHSEEGSISEKRRCREWNSLQEKTGTAYTPAAGRCAKMVLAIPEMNCNKESKNRWVVGVCLMDGLQRTYVHTTFNHNLHWPNEFDFAIAAAVTLIAALTTRKRIFRGEMRESMLYFQIANRATGEENCYMLCHMSTC